MKHRKHPQKHASILSGSDILDYYREFPLCKVDESWIPAARVYLEEGDLNEELMFQFIHAMQWFQFSEQKKYYEFAKRIFDISVVMISIPIWLPLVVLLALLIKVSSPGPILFKQLRIGKFGTAFWVLKFRTMFDHAQAMRPRMKPMEKRENDPRVTSVGKFLRKYKLDELPQLFNVLTGEMSLVGPRPFSPEESATTPRRHYLRFAVLPGLTGNWQVHEPNTIDGTLKIKLDFEYVLKRGFIYDLKIILRTFPVLLKGEHLKGPSIYSHPNVQTDDEDQGNKKAS